MIAIGNFSFDNYYVCPQHVVWIKKRRREKSGTYSTISASGTTLSADIPGPYWTIRNKV